MSVTPSCAIVDPSVSSTIEWTIDCGCTTTSMRSAGTSNSQCASMTSRPLFISVAESIVILRPICQVGCRSASSGRAVVKRRADHVAKRPARGGENERLISSPERGRAGTGEWRCARCPPAARATPRCTRRLHHHLARHDQHFLVGERNGLARIDRGQHGLERRGAGRGAQHDVDVGMRGDLDRAHAAPTPTRSPRRGSRATAGRCRRRVRWRRSPAGSARSARQALRRCRPAASPTTDSRSACASMTASALVPIEPVDPRIASALHCTHRGPNRNTTR